MFNDQVIIGRTLLDGEREGWAGGGGEGRCQFPNIFTHSLSSILILEMKFDAIKLT